MLSDLLWVFILILLAAPGLRHPHIALSGVVFVDILKPQGLSHSFLAGKPISFIFFLIFFISLIVNLRQISIPKNKLSTVLLVLFMIWITAATYNAQFQHLAWFKYDYAIKTLFFALFIPFVLNARVKLDTFIAILVASISFYTMIAGMKTLLGGGGYGVQFFSLSSKNAGMNESSTLAMVSVINIPFIIYLMNHSVFKDRITFIKPTGYLLIFASITSVIGSYARTGLVGLFLWMGMTLRKSKKKFQIIFILLLSLGTSIPFLPSEWTQRMNTISNPTDDSSAYGRVVVWKWTIDYVKNKPFLGGGFFSYKANAGVLGKYLDYDLEITNMSDGKAFHNIYFEVLGEAGYVGLVLFCWMILLTFMLNRNIVKNSKNPSWAIVFASANNQVLLVYCVCGLFIGVAFYPWLYYFLGLAVSLNSIKPME